MSCRMALLQDAVAELFLLHSYVDLPPTTLMLQEFLVCLSP